MSSLNLTQFAANAVVPATGNNYTVVNVGFTHWLDDASSSLEDGNPILGWSQDVPDSPNQFWSYLTYPSSDDSIVFTLQALSTIQSESGSVIDGRGGYMRVDPETNKIVHGGQPQAWTLIEFQTGLYKFAPFESAFNPNGTLVVTDVNETISDTATNQLVLQPENSTNLQQLWTFH